MSVDSLQPDDRVRLTRVAGEDYPAGFLGDHVIGDDGHVVSTRDDEACVAFGEPDDIWWIPEDWLEPAAAQEAGA